MGDENREIEDFTEPTTRMEGVKTGVFWDVTACPFPQGLSPDSIYEKVESVLKRMGTSGVMTIWAYVDANEPSWADLLREKTWNSRIYFLPAGDIVTRRMLNDILFWAIDSPNGNCDRSHMIGNYDRSDMIVVSDKIRRGKNNDKEFLNMLYSRYKCHFYNVLMVDPAYTTELDISPDNPDWPASLLDEAFEFVD